MAGNSSTFAGNGQFGFSGDRGPATIASFFLNGLSSGLAVDKSGDIFIPDTRNGRVRKVSPIWRGAGGASSSTGTCDAKVATQLVLSLTGIAVDPNGNLCVASFAQVCRIDLNDNIATLIAGNGSLVVGPQTSIRDGGPATQALLNQPTDSDRSIDPFMSCRQHRGPKHLRMRRVSL
jgi:DNA-binding beta-propeller fold protein YncE